MDDIRNTLKPFTTVLKNHERKPQSKKIIKNANLYLQEGTAEIYNDSQGNAVNVNIVWGERERNLLLPYLG